jgi:hypothetical protein
LYEDDKEIESQIIDANSDDTPELLIFQSGFKGNESKTYMLRSDPKKKEPPTLTHAKYILPRKDVAWENDHIAYNVDHGEGADIFDIGKSLGAGWTRSGDCSAADGWSKYLSMWVESLKFPMEVEVSAK